MPPGNQVRPQKWINVIDLYDDGENSAIWGSFDRSDQRVLGMRYNEDYPNQGGNSPWYVEPSFLTRNILFSLLDEVNQDASLGNIENILLALREHENGN